MLRLWELHVALSNQSGDPITYTPSTGTRNDYSQPTRFSIALLDYALYRAGNDILSGFVKQLLSQPHDQASRALQSLLPHLVFRHTWNGAGGSLFSPPLNVPVDPLFVYSVLLKRGNRPTLNVPYVNTYEFNRIQSNRTVFNSDVMCTLVGAYVSANNVGSDVLYQLLFDGLEDDTLAQTDPWTVNMFYLPMFPIVSRLAPTDQVAFEPSLIGTLLRRAHVYLEQDSQQIETAMQAYQLLEATQ